MSTREILEGRPEQERYRSDILILAPDYKVDDVSRSVVSALSSVSTNNSALHAESAGGDERLSDADREALFTGLRQTLKMKENCEGVPDIGVIEQALLRNPRMARNLKNLQDNGAQLVVTKFQAREEGVDGYVEFADAAVNLDVGKQEKALKALTDEERNSAIEQILQPLPVDQKQSARSWILSKLIRPKGAGGLNFAEALVYAVAHGGTLISHAVYDAMAKRGPNVFEDKTWTWHFKILSDVMSSGVAPGGGRRWGGAGRGGGGAGGRGDRRGGRVAGLRVEIA